MEGMVQQAVTQNLMNVAKVVEDQLDEQIYKLENMNDDDLDSLRKKRIESMKKQQIKKQKWLEDGHGEYREVHTEKDFFKEMKGVERMVCHFYRENWPCKVMDKHLREIAAKHVETKFIKIDAEKSPYLTEKLKIWMLPTLCLVKNEKVEDYVIGFNELGGSDDFPQSYLLARLANSSMLNYEGEGVAKPKPLEPGEAARKIRTGGHGTRELDSEDENSDFSDEE
ncbi:hypothetical protein CYMTET_51200 [Cymbomonas tetramitiformis]|uniref:Thioredoxin domain-containing protein n=1 Tax=Cymbomonas tetramitiformis TaxID=36881 RepID=A0AAE0ESD6_9CHLO|nr:hypothetical protein CYMTET_51200 [Cymbomonas tetramitiformis]